MSNSLQIVKRLIPWTKERLNYLPYANNSQDTEEEGKADGLFLVAFGRPTGSRELIR